MGKVSMGIISLAIISAILVAPVAASLMPLNFGFPVLVRSGQAVSFSNDLASFTDSESLNIDFPMFDGIMGQSGPSSLGMNGWPTQGMAAPDMSHMGTLFDLSGFKFH